MDHVKRFKCVQLRGLTVSASERSRLSQLWHARAPVKVIWREGLGWEHAVLWDRLLLGKKERCEAKLHPGGEVLSCPTTFSQVQFMASASFILGLMTELHPDKAHTFACFID